MQHFAPGASQGRDPLAHPGIGQLIAQALRRLHYRRGETLEEFRGEALGGDLKPTHGIAEFAQRPHAVCVQASGELLPLLHQAPQSLLALGEQRHQLRADALAEERHRERGAIALIGDAAKAIGELQQPLVRIAGGDPGPGQELGRLARSFGPLGARHGQLGEGFGERIEVGIGLIGGEAQGVQALDG